MRTVRIALLVSAVIYSAGLAQDVGNTNVDKWVTVTGVAAGEDIKAQDEAIQQAKRKAVEEACGVFIRAQSKATDFKGVYDKVIANTVGYVVESKNPIVKKKDGKTFVTMTVRVSTKKFEEDWARIAHTIHQEGNPRVIIIIAEVTDEIANELLEDTQEKSSTETTATVETTATADAMRSANITRTSEGYIWVDRFNRRWRFRGRTQIGCISGETVTADETASARSHFLTTLKIKTDKKSEKSRQVWKRIASKIDENGAVQTKLEEFFLDKGVKLMDKNTTSKVNKRDIMLAMADDNMAAVAALGAKFNADVIIMGTASSKFGNQTELAGKKLFQYNSKLVLRAVRTDSGQLMVAKTFGPTTTNSLQRSGGESQGLAKLADDAAPKVLKAVVEAWRKQVNVSRDINLTISGMDYKLWKTFEKNAAKLRGVQSIRRREITASQANIDVEYKFSIDNLADNLAELADPKLEITEISGNRIKLKVVK